MSPGGHPGLRTPRPSSALAFYAEHHERIQARPDDRQRRARLAPPALLRQPPRRDRGLRARAAAWRRSPTAVSLVAVIRPDDLAGRLARRRARTTPAGLAPGRGTRVQRLRRDPSSSQPVAAEASLCCSPATAIAGYRRARISALGRRVLRRRRRHSASCSSFATAGDRQRRAGGGRRARALGLEPFITARRDTGA